MQSARMNPAATEGLGCLERQHRDKGQVLARSQQPHVGVLLPQKVGQQKRRRWDADQ